MQISAIQSIARPLVMLVMHIASLSGGQYSLIIRVSDTVFVKAMIHRSRRTLAMLLQ